MRKILSPRQESNRRTPIIQPVAQRYTDLAFTALLKNHTMPCHKGIEVKLHEFLTVPINGVEWWSSFSGLLTTTNHWAEDWVGPSAGLDVVAKKRKKARLHCR
jgi:hypothetical protein